MTVRNRKFPLFIVILLAVLTTVVSACAPASATDGLKMAPMSEMSDEVRQAPVTVQEAYQFAVANPDVLTQLPCYCGCGAVGHTSNYSCFVESAKGDDIVFATHGLGCSICVDIARDAMRMLQDGKSMPDIRAAIDADYSRFGPSNMP